jgi:hypothetical protein
VRVAEQGGDRFETLSLAAAGADDVHRHRAGAFALARHGLRGDSHGVLHHLAAEVDLGDDDVGLPVEPRLHGAPAPTVGREEAGPVVEHVALVRVVLADDDDALLVVAGRGTAGGVDGDGDLRQRVRVHGLVEPGHGPRRRHAARSASSWAPRHSAPSTSSMSSA